MIKVVVFVEGEELSLRLSLARRDLHFEGQKGSRP